MMGIDPARRAAYQRLFGRGLAAAPIFPGIDIGCDLQLTTGASGTAFAETVGVDNLAQALRFALTTLLGAVPFNTGYGFDGLNAMVTETDARMMNERIRISVAQTVSRDPRVRRVTDIQVARVPGTRTLQIDVTFDTTASNGLTLSVEGIPYA